MLELISFHLLYSFSAEISHMMSNGWDRLRPGGTGIGIFLVEDSVSGNSSYNNYLMYKARSFIPPLGGLFRLEGERALTFDGVSLLYFSGLTYESIFLYYPPGDSSL
jgi:hypothetical protein